MKDVVTMLEPPQGGRARTRLQAEQASRRLDNCTCRPDHHIAQAPASGASPSEVQTTPMISRTLPRGRFFEAQSRFFFGERWGDHDQ